MIDVKELRIGNFVLFPYEFNLDGELFGDKLPICSIQEDDTIRLMKGDKSVGCYHNSFIEPIPLTPEILEQCGFLKDNGNRFIKYTGEAREFLKIYLGDKLEDMWGKYQQVDMYIMFDHIKSLHQLQNLYFALTGEELQVNIHEKEKL